MHKKINGANGTETFSAPTIKVCNDYYNLLLDMKWLSNFKPPKILNRFGQHKYWVRAGMVLKSKRVLKLKN